VRGHYPGQIPLFGSKLRNYFATEEFWTVLHSSATYNRALLIRLYWN
jgi:hypothetical protein